MKARVGIGFDVHRLEHPNTPLTGVNVYSYGFFQSVDPEPTIEPAMTILGPR